MILLKIGEQQYRVAGGWEDITIRQASDLLAIPMPDKLRKMYTAGMTPGTKPEEAEKLAQAIIDSITLHERHKEFPKYYSKCIEVLSDIPGKVLSKTSVSSIVPLYMIYVQKFVEGIHFFPADYDYKEVTGFELDGVTYQLPVDRKIFGQSVPMVDVTALEFAESADLMIHTARLTDDRDFGRVANMIAILCRQKGEPYDEEVSLKRAEVFRDNLKMDVAWNVFFSLITPLIIAGQSMLISSLEEAVKGQSQ